MNREKALLTYIFGAIGQILVTCIIVFLLRNNEIRVDFSTILGVLAVGIGGLSSALWGAIVSMKYKKYSIKKVFLDFINVKQSYGGYLLVAFCLLLQFCYVLIGGKFQIDVWYAPITLFLSAILFGGIEEIGWRYTFQPILEEKINYIFSTFLTFLSWGIWHFLYFYITGTLNEVQIIDFLAGLLTSCFLLSAIYNKTNSLWLCVLSHALLNTFSQMTCGGNTYVLYICRGIAILLAIVVCSKEKTKHIPNNTKVTD